MATMKDVARRAGVSSSTVSHVLNGTRLVEKETTERVLAAIAETGYRRNVLARSLATSTTNTIGLSISALTNPYFGTLVKAVESRAAREGFTLVLGDSHDDPATEDRVVNSLLDQRVDGLIIAPSVGADRRSLPTVQASGTPLVLLDRFGEGDCDQVAPENSAPVRHLTSHLIDAGHSRIGAITGLDGLQSTSERLTGYLEALEEHSIEPDPSLVVSGRSNADYACAAVKKLMSRRNKPTALVVMNNAMTIGTMKALKECGQSVPRDLAIVCYDDFEWADFFEPRLTTFAQDVDAMGSLAIEMLLERIAGSDQPARHIRVPPEYKHRNSCGCA